MVTIPVSGPACHRRPPKFASSQQCSPASERCVHHDGRGESLAASRALPEPTPETQHFWRGAREGELRLQRCLDCSVPYFPPRPFCPRCSSRDIEVFAASGRARLYSYVISHRPAPGFEPPYAIAIVELDEGPRMMTNLVEVAQTPEALVLDMALEVVFEPLSDEISLPLFRPSAEGRGAAR
jgi:uncharacterized OB-fold protein